MSLKKGIINKIFSFSCSATYDKLEHAGIINWPLQATALSYYSLMGMVPFLALCFVVAKGFGLDADLSAFIDSVVTKYFASFSGGGEKALNNTELIGWQKDIIAWLKTFAENLISNYSGSLMAFVALGVIFWSAFRILTLMESVFGQIFGYNPSRRIVHRIMDYLTIMVILPLVLMAALAINVFLTGLVTEAWNIPGGIDPSAFKSFFVIFAPYLIIWLVFSWVYSYFSRGLLAWSERLLGGFISCLLFQACLAFYLKVMFSITSYNAIYGSFAFVPLFMIWLYLTWMIVLAGGEISKRFYDLFTTGRGFFSLPDPATWKNTLELSIKILREIGRDYNDRENGIATSFRQLSKRTSASLPTLGSIINRLLAVGLIVRISGPGPDGPSFLPSKSPDVLTDQVVSEILANGTLEIFN